MLEDIARLTAWIAPLIVLAAIFLPQTIRILREYERGVIFRLGKLLGIKGPGLIFLIPVVDRMVKMDLRVVTIDVARQEVMTRDNVPVTVDAVVPGWCVSTGPQVRNCAPLNLEIPGSMLRIAPG